MNRSLVAGLGVVVLWASAFPAIQVAVAQLGVVGLSVVRLLVASAALLVLALAGRIRPPRGRDLGWIAAAGFFGMAAYQLLLNGSELAVPAGTASIIVAGAPLVSAAVALLLLRERISLRTVVGSLLALAGVLVVCLARAGVSLSAAAWIAVAAMVVQGIYHPLQRPLLRRYTGLEVATYAMVAGTAMTLPLLPLGWADLTRATPAGWAAALYLGLLPSALGFVLWGYAVGRLPVAAATALLYLVPPVAVLIAWLWLGELPLPVEVLGGGVVIAGVAVVSLRGGHREPRSALRRAAARWRPGGRGAAGSSPPTTRSAPRAG
jgi:drug/metabolite transporter (DMT)-like permease